MIKQTNYIFCVTFAILALPVADSRADVISVIDQQQSAVTGFSVSSTAIGNGGGQSFTAGLNRIDAAEFILGTNGSSTSVKLVLYDGAGYTGTVLGESLPVAFTNTGQAIIHFDLITPVALTVGNVYSIQAQKSAGDDFKMGTVNSNAYAGGNFLGHTGAILGNDAFFSEGLHASAAVPEPSSFALLGVGVVGLIGYRRRKQNVLV